LGKPFNKDETTVVLFQSLLCTEECFEEAKTIMTIKDNYTKVATDGDKKNNQHD